MMRVGIGYDVHVMADKRRCILGGVEIPHNRGPLGHSDGDVLLHAISDAILGALGLGDIGQHFPDTSAKNKDIDSALIAKKAKQLIVDKGYDIENIDSTVIAEEPKLAKHIPSITSNIAKILGLQPEQVSVKATTHEKLGSLGRGEGIASMAVVLLRKK